MITSIKQKFKSRPTTYYAMSIAASWAAVGSILNFRTLARTNGLVPVLMWAIANTVACGLFGMVACHMPELRKVMKTKGVAYALGVINVFQMWVNMNGIREVFEDTPLGASGGTVIAYAIAILFIVILLTQGMIRNVLTDSVSWVIVYGLLYLLCCLAYVTNGWDLSSVSLGLEPENLKIGLWKAILLIPGPYSYAYFFELLDYNDENRDSVTKVDIVKSFKLSSALFGFYMLFSAALALINFTPWQNVIKAVLITLVATSSISSFLYSEYLLFGRKFGLLLDVASVVLWRLAVPMGVMGAWTLMSEIRIYAVAVILIIAAVRSYRKRTVGETI